MESRRIKGLLLANQGLPLAVLRRHGFKAGDLIRVTVEKIGILKKK